MTRVHGATRPERSSGFGRVASRNLSMRGRLLLVPAILTGLVAAQLLVGILTVARRTQLENPPPTPIIEDRYGRFLTEGLEEYDQLGYWNMPDELPRRITRALLATEDKRFYEHQGVDVRSVGRALIHNLTDDTVQGASTIAMQVARLQDPSRRVLINKLTEMITAISLVSTYGHDAVLRHYMRIVPLGHQIHGFAYAARRYFRKPIADVSWAEAALLASLPQSPSHTDLFEPAGYQEAKARARLILSLLCEAGDIDPVEYDIALSQVNDMPPLVRETRPVDSLHFIQRMIEQPGFYQESYERPVRSSLDLDMQALVLDAARGTLERLGIFGAGNVAAMVLDADTGEILAYLGSDDYFCEGSSGSINYAFTPRSSGSILKPFMFAYGLHVGAFTSGSIVADIPLHWMDPQGEYVVNNFDGLYLGPMLYGNALANSRNITAVRVLDYLGPDRIFDLFRQLNFHDGMRDWQYYGFGMILGGLYVTLEDLVRAYGFLASDGEDFELKWVAHQGSLLRESLASSVLATAGENVDDERGLLPAGLLNQSSIRLVTGYLSDPTRRLPSFPRLSSLEFRFPVAIKTGTSQGFRDAWAVGFSRRYVIGAWTGDPNNNPMNHVAGSVIAELVHDLFVTLQPEEREGFEYVPFPPPRDAVAVEVCTLSGMLAREGTPSSQVEYFVPGTEPTEFTTIYQRFAVDRRTGKLATPATPRSDVVTQLFPVLPAEYAAWAAENDMAPPEAAVAEPQAVTLEISYPPPGSRFIIDPTIPPAFQTIGLQAEVEPRVTEVVWLMDGEEFGRSGYPYTMRWPLTEGDHRLQVRFPNAFVASPEVSFTVIQ
jgi:penicillin-binding protein 1C